MERKAIIVSLVALLGLAILQAVAGVESSDAVAGAIDSHVESLFEPSEILTRVNRNPEAHPRRRGNINRSGTKIKKGKHTKKNKKPMRKQRGRKTSNGKHTKKDNKIPRRRGNRGKYTKGKANKGQHIRRKAWKANHPKKGKSTSRNAKNKGKGKKGKFGQGKANKVIGRQACDEKELCKRIKLYIKYSNQLRKAKRILNTCKTLKAKSAKAATAFVATADALKDSGDTAVGDIQEKLMNCSKSASAACDVGNVPQCADAEQAKITVCADKLKAWVNAFGPGPASCLGDEACCACINKIELVVPPECLAFDAVDQMATKMKKSCTQNEAAGGKAGSFGECRKQQMVAAEKGPAAFAKSCGKPGMTTAAVKRMSVLRKALGNKNIYR